MPRLVYVRAATGDSHHATSNTACTHRRSPFIGDRHMWDTCRSWHCVGSARRHTCCGRPNVCQEIRKQAHADVHSSNEPKNTTLSHKQTLPPRAYTRTVFGARPLTSCRQFAHKKAPKGLAFLAFRHVYQGHQILLDPHLAPLDELRIEAIEPRTGIRKKIIRDFGE